MIAVFKILSSFSPAFSDLETFAHFNFRFEPAEEAKADKKGLELFSKSPYKDQLATAALFLEALEARSGQLANLLHGRFSNDSLRVGARIAEPFHRASAVAEQAVEVAAEQGADRVAAERGARRPVR